ncbi:MAG: ankyrin repeat domain-containing protein, partial [Acidobacteriota bacterium]
IRHDLIEVVRRLLEGGAPVGLVDGDRTTPLAMASRFSRMEIALLLLENGANLEAMTERGYTPLQMAGSGEMEQFLLSQGARPRE